MSHEPSFEDVKKYYHGTFRSYIIGFFLSLLLTLAAFGLVAAKFPLALWLPSTIALLALLQAGIQVRFFLKLGSEGKPHWQSIIFAFLILVLLIITLGSLWIMFDLNARLMVMPE
ncbi:MAG: cytochrome C oxidase subunit IV family protein [Verrucomicrobiota bacterium]|nr:cytochrome C oxidase subunit IV family protein [Verrucomicrobiota bacterium]